jgi:uncharacterized protein (TIGR02757 family)
VRPHRPTPELPIHLESLYARFPFERSFDADPIASVRPLAWDARRGELAGIFASTLAIGSARAIRGAVAKVGEAADGDVARLVDPDRPGAVDVRLRQIRHRWIRGDQLAYLARRLARSYAEYGSLQEVFLAGFEAGGFAHGLDRLANELRGPLHPLGHDRPPRGYAVLFPSPLDRSRSPSKRLTLFVRWMVRPGYPDLGLWRKVPTGELRVPLDQHVHWIAYHLGLTGRRTRSWAAVEDVTEALRRIDPVDPTRYDFVLCHTGISGDCPKHRDLAVCGPCSVRPDCRLWRGRGIAA